MRIFYVARGRSGCLLVLLPFVALYGAALLLWYVLRGLWYGGVALWRLTFGRNADAQRAISDYRTREARQIAARRDAELRAERLRIARHNLQVALQRGDANMVRRCWRIIDDNGGDYAD